ncbi:bestrophin protein [Ceratobasidium sp. AG-Ba]|nr:bestrophin protein [Ceratobasidium sp. AG-Ba]
MSALKSVAKIIKGGPDLEHHRRRMRYYTWLVDVFRLDGSVTARIIGPVLTVTLWATFVAVMVMVYGHQWRLTNNVVPLLSVVVGLILVFRTSYDRYYEGRKDFGTVMSNVRNLSRLVWINANLPLPSEDKNAKQPSAFMRIRNKTYEPSTSIKNPVITSASLRIEKERALKLMIAFAVAVKHHLRGEEGCDWDDFIGLLPPDFSRFDNRGFDKRGIHGPRDYGTSTTITVPSSHGDRRETEDTSTDMSATLVPGSSPGRHRRISFIGNKAATPEPERDPLLGDSHQTVIFRPYDTRKPLPLPLIIAHELTRLIHKFQRSGILASVGPAGVNAMQSLVQSMIDQVTAMERVSNTPIPVSYSIHLKQSVSLYLFSLPFTLIGDLEWRMIPVVTLVAYTLMGIEGIANEIEMPFGRDPSDLPLDRYCEELRNEVEYIIENLPEGDDDLDPDDE